MNKILLPAYTDSLRLAHKNAIEGILNEAVAFRATDIHIDSRVRLRVNNKLETIQNFNNELCDGVILDLLAITYQAQGETFNHTIPLSKPIDGRWEFFRNNLEYAVRINFCPTTQGPKCTLRLLPLKVSDDSISSPKNGLKYLRVPDELEKVIRKSLDQPGAYLIAGTTGSGKSTVLSALLYEQAKDNLNQISIESPVERQIEGVTQLQVSRGSGTTFAQFIRMALRMDPDVIAADIHNAETASGLAIAGLTGHHAFGGIHAVTPEAAIVHFLSYLEEGQKQALAGIFYTSLISVNTEDTDPTAGREPFVTFYPFKYVEGQTVQLDHTATLRRLAEMKASGKIDEETYTRVSNHYPTYQKWFEGPTPLNLLELDLRNIRKACERDPRLVPILQQMLHQIETMGQENKDKDLNILLLSKIRKNLEAYSNVSQQFQVNLDIWNQIKEEPKELLIQWVRSWSPVYNLSGIEGEPEDCADVVHTTFAPHPHISDKEALELLGKLQELGEKFG